MTEPKTPNTFAASTRIPHTVMATLASHFFYKESAGNNSQVIQKALLFASNVLVRLNKAKPFDSISEAHQYLSDLGLFSKANNQTLRQIISDEELLNLVNVDSKLATKQNLLDDIHKEMEEPA